MQQAITALAAFHRQLDAALDAGDTLRVQELVQARQPHLEALVGAWRDASSDQRRQHATALQALQAEQQALVQRCLQVRDELQAQLAGGPRRTGLADRDVLNGTLDLQA